MNRSEGNTGESEVAAQSRFATDVTRPGRHAEPDRERIDRVRQALQHGGLDAVVCALPKNVLLLSGYWPVVGTSVAIATRDGRIALAVPADEQQLAEQGWADDLLTFTPGSLRAMQRAGDAVRAPLAKLCRTMRLGSARVGFEAGEAVQESSYAAIHLYGASFGALLMDVAPRATLSQIPRWQLHRFVATPFIPNLLCRRTAGSFHVCSVELTTEQLSHPRVKHGHGAENAGETKR